MDHLDEVTVSCQDAIDSDGIFIPRSSQLLPDVGNWVQGERFWGREYELVRLAELIRDGANIATSAPRRIGKTSLMREVARNLEGQFTAIHVDLQGATAPEDLLVELTLASQEHRDLHNRVLAVFRNLLGDVSRIQARELAVELRNDVGSDWQSKANRLLDEFVTNVPPVVVYIDELAMLVNRLLKGSDYVITPDRIAAVDRFMSWLRQATIRYTRRIRFVIANSIGLAPVLAQAKLSATLNTFTPFVDLLSEAAIAGVLPFASARALGREFDPQQLREVMDVLIHDGYLHTDEDAYVFSNKLLRDWWHSHHHLTHRPLATRVP